MHSRSARTTISLFSVALLVAAPLAGAQVTLNLTTPQQTNCTAVTDAQGLHLAPGSSNLIGTGVTLSGTGCGAVSDNYNVAVQVQTNPAPVSGTAFNIAWSASAQATQCFYTGSASVTGWTLGASACSGAACNGNHNKSVTVPAAGSYTFGVTCSNSSGGAQSTATVSGPPLAPQPPNFALSAASPVNINTPFNVSWSVTGAATCTATADLNGVSTILAGWTDVGTSPASPRSVTATTAGTYTLKMTCTNDNGSTLSAPATVVVNPVDGCPAGRQTLATVCYTYAVSGSSCAPNTDVTKFENIWGRNAPAGTPVLFPGLNYYNVIANLGAQSYIAAQFVMPLTGDRSGILSHGETLPGPNITYAISATCGDFAPASTQCGPGENIAPGAVGAKWKLNTYTGSNGCPLVPGQTYFINLKVTNSALCGAGGSGAACEISTSNNHTP